ncbi:MAG: MFS transporter [Hyphomicrobiales bacterium]
MPQTDTRTGPQPSLAGGRTLSIAAAILSISVVGIGLGLGLPLLSLVLEARGTSNTIIGLNAAVAGIISIATSLLIAPMARRIGSARLLIGAILMVAVSFPAFYLSHSIWVWFGLRLFFHSGLIIAFVLSEFWIIALAPPERRGLIMGIYASVLSVGFVVGPSILGAVGSDTATPFLIGTAIFLAGAILPIIAYGSVPVVESPPKLPILGFVFAVPLATFGVLVFGAIESGSLAMLPLFGLRLGYDETTAALLPAAVNVGAILLLTPLGLITDRVDRRRLLLACGVVGFLGAIAMVPAASSPLALSLVLLVWGGLVAGLYTVGLTHLASRFHGDDLVAANAAFVMMYSLGMLVGPASIGAALDATPLGFPIAVGVMALAYVVLAFARLAVSSNN